MKKTKQELQAENEELRSRLEEAEETLNAIRNGEIDALIVGGKDGQQIYTLTGADRTYRLLLESMREGAVTLNADGIIIYCNSFFAGLLKTPPDQLTGAHLLNFVPLSERQHFTSLLAQCDRGETQLKTADNGIVPVYLSANMLPPASGQQLTCAIVTDLSEQKRDEKIIADGKLSRLIIQQAAEAIIVCDKTGKIILASNAAHVLCGKNPLYQPFDELFPLTLARGKFFTIAHALRRRAAQRIDAGFLRKDGIAFDLILTSARLVDKNRKILGCIVTLSDITERKNAEKELRKSEQRFHTLAEEMPHFVWETDGDGTPLYANKRFYDYTGLSPEQALTGGWLAIQHPEDIPRVEAAWQQALTACAEYELETRFREEATGQYRWFQIKGSPVRDAAGLIYRWVGTCTDIHEQMLVEEALRESEERLQIALKLSRSFVFEWEPATDHVLRSDNCAQILGLADDEIRHDTGQRYFKRVHPDDRERFVRMLGELTPAANTYQTQYRVLCGDGATKSLEEFARGSFDAGGQLRSLVGITIDITERKHAEEESRHLHNIVTQERDRLLALLNNISDEIWFADTEGKFVLTNQVARADFCLDAPDAVDVRQLAERLEVLRPDGSLRPVEEAPPLRALRGEIVRNEDEMIITPANGELQYRQVSASPVRDADGNIIGSVSVVRDITERKQAEEALRTSEERFAFAMEAAQEGLWDWSKTIGKAYYSPRWKSMLGYDDDEIGDDFEEFKSRVHPDDRAHTFACVEKVLQDNMPQYANEFRLRHKDGHYVDILSRAYSIYDASGAIVRTVGTHMDITERKAIEKAQLFLLQCGQKEGEDFFESLARYLAEHLTMDFVCIDKLTGDRLSARTLAMYCDGHFEDTIEYTLHDTPCGDVVEKKICSVPRDVCRLFPKDAFLQEFKAESYVGTTLWSMRGEPIGLIAVIGRKPLADTSLAETILKLVAIRAGGELERRQAEELLRSTAQFPEENPSPVLRVSHDGVLLYANQSSDDLLDFWHCRFGKQVPKEIKAVLQEALRTGKTLEFEVTVRNRLKLSFVITPFAENKYCNLYGRDITAIRQAEASLHIVNARLDILAETASQLLKSEEPQLIVDTLCRRLMSFLDCQTFFNFLVDKERHQLHLNAFAGILQDEAVRIEWLDYGAGVCGCVARDGCRIVAEDIVNTSDVRTELVKSYGMQAYACHPLLSQGEVIGTLSFGTRTRPRFREDELSLMKAVADQVAIAMERKYAQDYIAQLNSNLQSNVQELEEEVTRRTRAEKVLLQYAEDLSRSNEELESFAAAVSHDLQEPLRSIAGFMRLLEKKYGNLLDSRGRDYIERAIASSKRLGTMINSLLSYSRIISRGKEFEHHALDAILDTALESLHASVSQAKALITHEPLPLIYGDPEQLSRVFQNLIGNSIKYCGSRRPEIHISCQRRADACIVAVKDNGEGIEPEYIRNIFDVFIRVPSQHNIAGTGMGLAVCKKIIVRHQGKLWAESEPGKGSTFFFSLPIGQKGY